VKWADHRTQVWPGKFKPPTKEDPKGLSSLLQKDKPVRAPKLPGAAVDGFVGKRPEKRKPAKAPKPEDPGADGLFSEASEAVASDGDLPAEPEPPLPPPAGPPPAGLPHGDGAAGSGGAGLPPDVPPPPAPHAAGPAGAYEARGAGKYRTLGVPGGKYIILCGCSRLTGIAAIQSIGLVLRSARLIGDWLSLLGVGVMWSAW
jgi:hypothetical protein